jgi:Flp pilus assembly protein TadG
MMRTPTFRRIRGQIAVLTALVMVVVIGAVGLAIDSGLGYIIRARLNSAVDAAGIAAARDVVIGATRSEQEASARQAAREFFDVNYPTTGFYHSTPALGNVGITWLANGQVRVNVSATSVVPVTLMRLFDFNLLNVSSAAEVLRKDLDMSFVMDTTDSMAPVVGTVKASAKSFLDHFNPSVDRIALIRFSHGAVVDVPFKADQSRGFQRDTMKTLIDGYVFEGFTNYSEGFWHARDQLNNRISMANRSTLRVVVFFSDGSPNTFASYFAFRTPSQCALPGALQTGAGGSGSPDGLWYHDRQSQALPGTCYRGTSIASYLTSTALPNWYNAHNVNDREFPVVGGTPRTVTSAPNWTNVNRAARNLPEAMAATSRSEGIYIYTLGLGSHVHDLTGPDNENGETLLKRMANTPDSSTYSASQPTGVYCWAATENDLMPCFAKLASEIMRITK